MGSARVIDAEFLEIVSEKNAVVQHRSRSVSGVHLPINGDLDHLFQAES
jgi:hypothetical protein